MIPIQVPSSIIWNRCSVSADANLCGRPDGEFFIRFVVHRNLTDCLYGRPVYEVKRYWDDNRNVENAEDHDFVRRKVSVAYAPASKSISRTQPRTVLACCRVD